MCAVPNVVLTKSGRVGGPDLQRLEGRVHEWGALYQAQSPRRFNFGQIFERIANWLELGGGSAFR